MAKKIRSPKHDIDTHIIQKEMYEKILSENQTIFEFQQRENALRKTYLIQAVTKLYIIIGACFMLIGLFYDFFLGLFRGEPIRLALFLGGASLIMVAYIFAAQARYRIKRAEENLRKLP